jgi:acyl-CoA thioester hydrolase
MTGPRIAPIAPQVFEALQAIMAAHENLPKPEQAGRRIGIARKA